MNTQKYGIKRKSAKGMLRRVTPKTRRLKSKRIDYSLFLLSKPKRKPEPVKVYPDGREVCNLKTDLGRTLYMLRIAEMVGRQTFRCSIGGEYLPTAEATFEHGNGRGAGKRDDRINIVDAEGYYINSAACGQHNCEKGSRRNYPLAVRVPAKELTK